MADVLIAGGGIAGAALAVLLGRQGLSVELYERSRFPRDKTCGEGLMPAGVEVLDRLGLRQQAGGACFYGICYHFGSRRAEGRFPNGSGLGQRRTILDKTLFDEAARTPGVTAQPGVRVDRPLVQRGRVVGLVVEGRPRFARLTVAADGVRSPVRRALGLDLPPSRSRIGMRAHFRLREDRCLRPWVEVFSCPGYELYLTPLPHRELLVAALADAGSVALPARRTFSCWLRQQPVVAELLEGAQQVSPLQGVAPLGAGSRRGVVPGAALLGDAAGFLDPITGGGMAQALMTAELLARSMPRWLDAGDEWLFRFERDRRRMLRRYEFLTAALLWLSYRRGLAERLLSLLRLAPGIMSRLLRLLEGRPPG
ncbi:MAG: NAD(P)/FAD-dependent oxidoreductase [Bryobacteraceae bacterium]|nr:NAD(P)/FAD-dependent oxidoreductase [Bryobacteraceae bacterium]